MVSISESLFCNLVRFRALRMDPDPPACFPVVFLLFPSCFPGLATGEMVERVLGNTTVSASSCSCASVRASVYESSCIPPRSFLSSSPCFVSSSDDPVTYRSLISSPLFVGPDFFFPGGFSLNCCRGWQHPGSVSLFLWGVMCACFYPR